MIQKKLYKIHDFVDFSVIFGMLLGVIGTYWDIKYHIDVGRDSFWILPHLMVYAGVVLVFIASILAYWFTRHSHLSKKLGLAIIAIFFSVTLQFITAPIDDIWHKIFGLDVTVWSPPHLLLLFAGQLIAFSLIYFQRIYMHIAKLDKIKKLTSDEFKLELIFAIALVGLNIVLAEFEYFRTIPLYHLSQLRRSWIYMFALTLQFVFIFSIAKILVKNKWCATRIALFYFLIRLIISLLLFGKGSWPIFPSLVFIPAIFFDLIFNKNLKNIILSSIIFTFIFYITQKFYFQITQIPKYALINIFDVLLTTLFAIIFSIIGCLIGNKIIKSLINKLGI